MEKKFSGALTTETRTLLNKKMEKTVLHFHEIEANKKAASDGFREELKAAKARIRALAEALDKNELNKLVGTFFDSEIEGFRGY